MYKPLRSLRQLCLLASLVVVFGCKKDLQESIVPEPELQQRTEGKTNPFSVANVNKALANLRAKSPNARLAGTAAVVGATHRYVKFRPGTADQMVDLDQSGFAIETEPMDENAVTYKAPLHPTKPTTNRIPEEGMFDLIPELYSVVPINYPLPTNVPVTVLEELVLFDTDSGDEKDGDEWVPQPPPVVPPKCDDGLNRLGETPISNRKPCPHIPARIARVNQTALMNEKLKAEGIDPVELYNEAMRISGNEEETMEKATNSSARRYYPSGTLTVHETALNAPVVLKGVQVKARRWFKVDNTYTNANGRFSINKGFRKKATLIVIFKNNAATVRGITGALKVWEYALPLSYQIGRYSQSSMENLTYNFSYVSDSQSKGAAVFVAATFMNSLWDIYTIHAPNNQLPLPPSGLNIWVSSAVTRAASAPMLRRLTETSGVSQAINWLLLGTGRVDLVIAKRLMQRLLPDITCRYQDFNGNTQSSNNLTNTFLHELSHAMHYTQAGNDFWTVYIAYIIANGGYGNKSSGGSERIAVSEGWAFYAGNTFTATNYSTTRRTDLTVSNRNELENQRPADDRWENWIVFGMLHDMTDVGEPPTTNVLDNVDRFNTGQLFWALRPNVKTVRDYREQIRTYYGTIQPTQVDQLVTSYRY